MLSKFHGKHYYIEFNSKAKALIVLDALANSKTLKDEKFELVSYSNKCVIVSERLCFSIGKEEGFRGKKYHEWERIKAFANKIKKEES